jgi:hypothetical protein
MTREYTARELALETKARKYCFLCMFNKNMTETAILNRLRTDLYS